MTLDLPYLFCPISLLFEHFKLAFINRWQYSHFYFIYTTKIGSENNISFQRTALYLNNFRVYLHNGRPDKVIQVSN